MKTTIEVTWDDLDFGERNSPWECMFARALNRCDPHRRDWMVDCSAATSLDNYANVVIPSYVAAKIEAWDRGEMVGPFSTILELPE